MMYTDNQDIYEKRERPNIFSPDGIGTEVLRQTGGTIMLTVMWAIGCLPIITIGTSTAALYYAIMKSVRKNCGHPSKEFFRAYKRNLKTGIAATCILLALAGIIGYEIWLVNVNGLALGDTWTVASKAMLGVLGVIGVYIFPVMSRFSVKFSALWKLAFVMAIRSWYLSLLYVLLFIFMAILQWQVLPMPLILITPGLTVYIGSYLMERAMKKYMPLAEGENEEWYS